MMGFAGHYARRVAVFGSVLALTAFLAPRSTAQRYHVHTYSEDDGLPSARIYDVVQDPTGRMWFATRTGIAVYDGLSWTTYNSSNGLSHPDQAGLALDPAGTLWAVSTLGGSVASWRDGMWKRLAKPAWSGLDAGRVWSFAVTLRDGEAVAAVSTSFGRLFYWDGKEWSTPAEEGTAKVLDLVAHEDRFFVATSQGLALLDGGGIQPVEIQSRLPTPEILALAWETGERRNLWMAGPGWLGVWNQDDGRFRLLSKDIAIPLEAPYQDLRVEPDGRGGAFLGNASGLIHFDPNLGHTVLDPVAGLLAVGATALYRDREGNLWVGSLRGLSKIVSLRFANYDRRHGLLQDEVTAVLERRQGGYVLGHPLGLTYLEPGGMRTQVLDSGERGPVVRVLDLAEDRQGRLWVAMNALGVARIDPSGAVSWYPELRTPWTASVRVTRDGTLWAAGGTQLYRFDGRDFVPVPGPAYRIRRLIEGPRGQLFLATQGGGVQIYDEGSWSQAASDNPASNNVFSVLEDRGGKLWVGTAAGLFQRRGSGLARASAPRVSRPVYFLTEDTARRLWIGTDNGVLRWDGKTLTHLTVLEGLIGRETNRAAGVVDSQGQVWIGTDRGVSVYRESFEGVPLAPLVELRHLDSGDQSHSLAALTSLPHRQNDLRFTFQALSFRDETRLLFRSWLEGYETSWLDAYAAPNREIRYTNLPPGHYRFHLQAAGSEGVWSETVSSAPIVIAPPFWQRSWFYGLVVLAFTGSFYLTHRYLIQRRDSRLLEAEVERRTAELAAQKRRLAVTLDSITDAVVATAKDGTVLLVNPAAEAILETTSAASEGRPIGEILRLELPPRDDGTDETAGAPLDPVARVMTAGGPVAFGEALHRVGERGEERRLEVTGAPIGETEGGVVLAFRDVTERRRLENEALKAQKLEALGLLAGGIAHDFNNLLTAVLGYIELVELHEEPGSQNARYLSDAEAAVLASRELTQRLLTFSKGGAPIRQPASIAEVIRTALGALLGDGSLHCDLSLPEDLWSVWIDPGQIQQALGNVLLNARQAMPEGGRVRLRAANHVVEEGGTGALVPGRYVSIEIEDQGTGIAAQHLAKIFDPYFSTREAGRGLGLATAYSIVKNHQGLLTVTSELGQGSTFRLDLPAAEEEVRAPEAVAELQHGRGRVLVMDDEKIVRMVLSHMLKELGYSILEAEDGEEALALCQAAQQDGEPLTAVILDLTIPGGLGGRETLERLRRFDSQVPAIVCSGYSNDPVMACYREHGFQAVLPKPFSIAALAKTLGELSQLQGH